MAEQKRDYYEILGVAKDATPDQIKSAYRKLALKYHPDRNPGDETAKAKFQEASEAYEVLSNAEKRQRYDQFGHQGVNFGPGGFDFGRDFSGFRDVDLSDILGQFFRGGFGGGFADVFGGGARRSVDPNAPQRGDDLEISVEIEFDEALFGSVRTLDLRVPDTCSECGGTGAARGSKRVTCPTCGGRGAVIGGGGFFQVRQTCPRCGGEGSVVERPCGKCRGEGRVPARHSVELRIPAGVDTGSRLRLAGKGASGVRGGEPGDMIVSLRVRPSGLFEREEANLAMDLPVSPLLAALGGEVEVPTPQGTATLRLAAGTANGSCLRLRGKGVPHLRGGGAGDLLVRIVVEVPARLTGKQRAAAEELVRLLDDGNFPARKEFERKVKIFDEHRERIRTK